ncbi:MAG: peptidase [bacterium]|nr:peptidase [bacterium]
MKRIIVIILFLCLFSCKEPVSSGLVEKLRGLPGVRVEEIKAEAPFKNVFKLWLTQPLNHEEPEGEVFEQQLILSHSDVTKPMVLVTEGYGLGYHPIRELSELLVGNELRVEHRFFGKSKPGVMNWHYLNLKQATADYHRIVGLFKQIYKARWVSTGWSKGGQTALTFRSYYPGDVAATVAYDTPLNFAVEDPRIDKFFDTVGTEECRERLRDFQRRALENKKELLPLFKKYAREKTYNFSIGEEKAFEYVVLEYPFSFWQYKKIDCGTVPGEGASPEVVFEHLKGVVAFSSYSDRAMNSPSMYQFFTEFGYYGYVKAHVKDLLSDTDYSNGAYAPRDVRLKYNPEVMKQLSDWLQTEGNNIIYIYGDLDPWSAPAVELTGKTNALKIFLKGGNHFTFINTFPVEQKGKIMSTLSGWLK